MKQPPLTIPVYLNQRIVFDLLAMTEDGISTVKNVSIREEMSSELNANTRGSFGLSNALSSLLKVDITADIGGKGTDLSESTTNHEKVHTPSSLFYQLKKTLIKRNELVKISSDQEVKIGDIVEFTATLSRNPFVETLDSLMEMLKLAENLEEKPPVGKRTAKKKIVQSTQQDPLNQISAILDSLKTGNTIDLKAEILSNKQSAVIVADVEYLNDPQMSDLVDGTFNVMGKVIRAINDDTGSINLLRKTPFSRISTTLFAETFGQMQEIMRNEGFNFPELTPLIPGPAIQVIPIAIYT